MKEIAVIKFSDENRRIVLEDINENDIIIAYLAPSEDFDYYFLWQKNMEMLSYLTSVVNLIIIILWVIYEKHLLCGN
jgi:hypothetical protein